MTTKKSSGSRQRSRPAEPKKANPNVKTIIILAVIAIIIVVAVSVLYMVNNTDGDTPEGNSIAVINTSMGTIKVELYEDKVPNTCENFIKLANDGFYSGLVFHRVANLIPDKPETHIIQGGGFTTDGTPKESPYGAIDLEINPEVRHVDGAIAMARTNDPNSATSQFYICDGAQSFLDDNYAAFGVVIDGMDVLRDIALVSTATKNGMSNWPVEDVTINSIIIESQ